MPKTLTLSELTALNPCNLSDRAKLFDGDGATDIRAAFKRGATVSDICWLMGALGMRDQIAAFAQWCADATRAARADAAYAAARAARAAYAAADAARAAARAVARTAYADAAYAAAIESQKAELIRLIEESE